MVFFMEGGFGLLEAGLVRRKNVVEILMKIFADCTVGMVVFWVLGFALMFGQSAGGLAGISGFGLGGDFRILGLEIPLEAFWLFQMAFAIAAISIVSGAVAERMKFSAYLVLVMVMVGLIYPLSGHWVWNPQGWLGRLGMVDFAGSGVIHALGGWAALAAAQVLGPRIGKYNPDGSPNQFPANNLPMAAAGTFILWFGWFFFNAGSTLSGTDVRIASIAVTTNLAAAAGGVVALFLGLASGKTDLGQTINGVLAGLVAITAGANQVTPWAALVIGAIGGLLMVLATPVIDRIADDPVGAVAVHGVNGVWGVIAVGLFAQNGGALLGGGAHLLLVQLLGAVSLSLLGYTATRMTLGILHRTAGIRVASEVEVLGLDRVLHGTSAYTADQEAMSNAD